MSFGIFLILVPLKSEISLISTERYNDSESLDSVTPSNSSVKSAYSQETSRRSNPFKVSSGKSKTNNAVQSKGFFESVEKEKSILAKKASDRACKYKILYVLFFFFFQTAFNILHNTILAHNIVQY